MSGDYKEMTDEMMILRDTILGKTQWRQCRSCNGTGTENWNEDGEDIRPGHTSDETRCNGDCENCGGLGFVTGLTME